MKTSITAGYAVLFLTSCLVAVAILVGRHAPRPAGAASPADDGGPQSVTVAEPDPGTLNNRIRALEAHVQELRADVHALKEGER